MDNNIGFEYLFVVLVVFLVIERLWFFWEGLIFLNDFGKLIKKLILKSICNIVM